MRERGDKILYPDAVDALVPQVQWLGLVCHMLIQRLFDELLNRTVTRRRT